MRKIFFVTAFLAGFLGYSFGQTITITDARAGGANKTVSISGTILNGTELDPVIRYIQDETGGIAIYSSAYASQMSRGDNVSVTGVVKDYNNLLEIDPVSVFTKVSSGNKLPNPVIVTPGQWSDTYEGMLVKVEGVLFSAGGTTFAGKTNYTITAGGQTGQVRVSSATSPIVGQIIPSDTVTLIGILSQFSTTYQLLLRDLDDIVSSKAINLRSAVSVSNITSTGFTLNWLTDIDGTTEAKYGKTPELELGYIPDQGITSNHSLEITGASASEFLYVQPFSVVGEDTVKAPSQIHITGSLSTGSMKTYFNRSVDNSVSILSNAVQLDHAIDDTLISYINRATESIDFTIYNFNNAGISNISNALNAANSRGVKVRVVYDSNTDNLGITQLDAAIGKIASPTSNYPFYGIMHNKFVVFDAHSSNPDLPVVWTGATNFTDGQINTDPNNVIIIQDQSLAKTYTLEFNEMFGNEGELPDPDNSKFGPDKLDNTPHYFLIGGKKLECYFSPSDGTNSKILESIKSADHQLYIATMLITRTELGYEIRNEKNASADVKVLLHDVDESTASALTVSTTLQGSLGGNFRTTGESGIMHHKYLIADPSFPDSDPLVLTGCHNWSGAAEDRNDENTLIIHSQEIADQYLQEFTSRFSNGVFVADAPECKNDFYTLSATNSVSYDVTTNDKIPFTSTLSIIAQPSHGTASVSNNSTIVYTHNPDFTYGIDTVSYKICLSANSSLCDEANFIIFVNRPSSTPTKLSDEISIYPVPANDFIFVKSNFMISSIEILDLTGKCLHQEAPMKTGFSVQMPVFQGICFMRISLDGGETVTKKIVIQ